MRPASSTRRPSAWFCLSLCLSLIACATEQDPTDAALQSVDQDDDSILDAHEGAEDADSDGVPNYLDPDADNDGISDAVEAGDTRRETYPRDSDADGTPDFLDLDSDGNKIPDKQEVGLDPAQPLDLDLDGLPDFVDPDNDGDLIADFIELGGQVPLDSDGDGIFDYQDLDSDSDRILDRDEAGEIAVGELPRDTDQDGIPDYRDLDSDGDSLSDQQEAGDKDLNSAPFDTDQDGASDAADLDADGDALTDLTELTQGSDPYQYDSDGDGASDGVEFFAGSDSMDRQKLPLIPWLVVPQRARTSRTFDFSLLVAGADVVFAIDISGSMSDDIRVLADQLQDVVESVRAEVFDVNFGLATYQDYASISMNMWPYRLVQQLTVDADRVQAAMAALVTDGGSGAGYEALYQVITGRGYDENCDMRLDAGFEVPPFISEPGDVFGGTSADTVDLTDLSTGGLGGAGFRAGAYPLIVYIGDIVPDEPGVDIPINACPSPSTSRRATSTDVISAAIATGTRIMGVYARNDGPGSVEEHMRSLAFATGAVYDEDGDGNADDPLVFSAAEPEALVQATIAGITSAVSGGGFNEVSLVLKDDPYGFLFQTNPVVVENVTTNSTVSFDVTFEGVVPANADDQIFALTMQLLGDNATSLSQKPVLIVVPGERNISN